MILNQVNSTITIEVPRTAYWPDNPRTSGIHGIGCQDIQVWVTDVCDNTVGEWVQTTIVQSCASGTRKAITIDVDHFPAHIVMFITMDKDHENLWPCRSGGSK